MAIYTITRVTGTTEAGSRLTDKEMEEFRRKRDDLCASVGGKAVSAYKSFTGKGNIVIYSYPSLEAAEKVRMGLWTRSGMNLIRYWTYEQDILYEMPLNT